MDDDPIEAAVEAVREFHEIEEVLVNLVEKLLVARGETPTPFAMLSQAINMEIGRVHAMEPDPTPALRSLGSLKSFAGALALRDTDGARA